MTFPKNKAHMYIAQHDWASMNMLQNWAHTLGYMAAETASGKAGGRTAVTGNWMMMMMVEWTRGCKCKDLPVCTPEWRQCVHGHGFRQGTDTVPAPWVRQSPASSAQRRKIQKYVSSLPSLLAWFSPGRELLGHFTVYFSSLSFVVCFAGLLWLLVVHRHTENAFTWRWH